MIPRLAKAAALLSVFVALGGASAYLTMTLIVKAEKTVSVPDLAGMDAVEVLQRLALLGLNAKLEGFEFSSAIDRDRVVRQAPAPGAEIKEGREVRIVLSKGPETLVMPDLKGISPASALILMERKGIRDVRVSETHGAAEDENLVIAQFPEAGSRFERGLETAVLVGLGERFRAVMVPSLVGLPLKNALLEIEKSGLRQGSTASVRKRGSLDDAVLKQAPPAGFRAEKGTAVDLTVNRLKERTADLYAHREFSFRHRLAPGFLRTHVEIILETPDGRLEIYDEFADPGEQIWVLLPEAKGAELLLFENGELLMKKKF